MRPEILFPLYASITSLKGVGPRVQPLLTRVAGPIVRDVLFLQPHAVIRRTPATLSAATDGQVMTFEVVIDSYEPPRSRAHPWRVRVSDPTGFMTLVFFGSYANQLPARHPVGARRIISGKIEDRDFGRQMPHPDYILEPGKAGDIPQIEAIYPATEGLPARSVRRFVLEALSKAPDLAEWQDPALLQREGFPPWQAALARLHGPQDEVTCRRWRPTAAASPMTNFWPTNSPWRNARPQGGANRQLGSPPAPSPTPFAPPCPLPSPAPRTAPWPTSARTWRPASG